jgi:hypothetical protein
MDSESIREDLSKSFRKQITQTARQPYLLALLIGSLLLSAASFYTTFIGMNSFAPNPFVNFCIVFAIQVLLFVTSWRIGFSLADREPLPLFTIFVFLICISTSVFFSWAALFGTINTEEERSRTRIIRAQRAVEDVNSALFQRLSALQREQVQVMINARAYADWSQALEKIGAVALNARAVIETQRDAAVTRAAQRIQNLEAQKAALLSEAAEREQVAATAERERARLAASRPEIDARVNRLRSEVEQAAAAVVVQEGLMEAEDKGGAAGSGAGRGPIWRQLRDTRNILKAEWNTQSRLFNAAEAELMRTDQRIQELSANIAAARGATVDAEIATIQTRLKEIQAAPSLAGGAAAGGLEEDVDGMNDALANFQSTFDLAALDKAAAQCNVLYDILRANETLAQRIDRVSCDRSGLASYLKPIRQASDAQLALAGRCALGGVNALDVSTLRFDQAISYGRDCITVSRLPVELAADLRNEFDRLVNEEAPNATAFVQTMNAWAGRNKLAYLALAIAIFIDLLVLFSGLIGALSGSGALRRVMGWRTAQKTLDEFKNSMAIFDDPIQSAKDLISMKRPYNGPRRINGVSANALVDLSQYSGHDRKLLRGFLLSHADLALAIPDDDFAPRSTVDSAQPKAEFSSNLFLVSKKLVRALEIVAGGKEEIENNSVDLGIAGHLDRGARRAAANAVLKNLTPFEPDPQAQRAYKGFRLFVDLNRIDDGTVRPGHTLREDAAQVLVGLYNLGFARGYEAGDGTIAADLRLRYFLTKGALQELAGAPAQSDRNRARDSTKDKPEVYEAGPPQSRSIEQRVLNAREPVVGMWEQRRRGTFFKPAVAYVDLADVIDQGEGQGEGHGDGKQERIYLNNMHFSGKAFRVTLPATSMQAARRADRFLLKKSAIDELKKLAQADIQVDTQADTQADTPSQRAHEQQLHIQSAQSAPRLEHDEEFDARFDDGAPPSHELQLRALEGGARSRFGTDEEFTDSVAPGLRVSRKRGSGA